MFFGDEGDWMELVGNLIDNAFKWANSSVHITISNMTLEAHNSHRQGVQIEVDDDGPGIDSQLRKTIIERGVRLDSQTPGHGLGLHIVKGIIEAYQGDLALSDSEQPQASHGTRFVVRLM